LSNYTYEEWSRQWQGGIGYLAFGWTDGLTSIIWHDGDVLMDTSTSTVWERIHPIVAEELRGIAREQRNNRRLLEAL
jgi:hypothetical protein